MNEDASARRVYAEVDEEIDLDCIGRTLSRNPVINWCDQVAMAHKKQKRVEECAK